mmetsp:Transcript_7874/g.24161  ORF Transcript_7874/g.24161 Transcript_7874/m.24161 type:complete len:549 (+) Transcript_7874:345-1991(+)
MGVRLGGGELEGGGVGVGASEVGPVLLADGEGLEGLEVEAVPLGLEERGVGREAGVGEGKGAVEVGDEVPRALDVGLVGGDGGAGLGEVGDDAEAERAGGDGLVLGGLERDLAVDPLEGVGDPVGARDDEVGGLGAPGGVVERRVEVGVLGRVAEGGSLGRDDLGRRRRRAALRRVERRLREVVGVLVLRGRRLEHGAARRLGGLAELERVPRRDELEPDSLAALDRLLQREREADQLAQRRERPRRARLRPGLRLVRLLEGEARPDGPVRPLEAPERLDALGAFRLALGHAARLLLRPRVQLAHVRLAPLRRGRLARDRRRVAHDVQEQRADAHDRRSARRRPRGLNRPPQLALRQAARLLQRRRLRQLGVRQALRHEPLVQGRLRVEVVARQRRRHHASRPLLAQPAPQPLEVLAPPRQRPPDRQLQRALLRVLHHRLHRELALAHHRQPAFCRAHARPHHPRRLHPTPLHAPLLAAPEQHAPHPRHATQHLPHRPFLADQVLQHHARVRPRRHLRQVLLLFLLLRHAAHRLRRRIAPALLRAQVQ